MFIYLFFFFKQKTAYDMRISDWSSDVCSSDLRIWALAYGDLGMIKRVRRLPGGTYRLRSDGAVPCMELPSHIPNDLDYDWYVHKAETKLCNMGAMADSPVHVECTTSKRSEERRVGNECVRTGRYRWSPE